MKIAFASLAAAGLGVALGWKTQPEGGGVEMPGGRSNVEGRPPAAGAGAEAAVRLGFGAGWRTWARRIGEADDGASLAAIFEQVVAMGDARERSAIERLLAARWAEVDPAGGASFLRGSTEGRGALLELLTEWSLHDREAAIGPIEDLAGPAGAHAWDSVLGHLMRRAPEAALSVMRRAQTYVRYPDSRSLELLARAKPDALAELIVEIEAARLGRGEDYGAYNYLRAVAAALAEHDPAAALAWAEGLDGRMGRTARSTVISEWARHDPESIARHFEGSDEIEGHSDLADAVLSARMAWGDLDGAVVWARSRGGIGGNKLAEAIAERMAAGDLGVREAYDAVSGMRERDWIRDTVFGSMWTRLRGDEFDAAFETLVGVADGEPRQRALGGLMRSWLSRDREAAVAACDRLPRGAARDAILGQMAGGIAPAERAVASFPPADRPAVVAAIFSSDPVDGEAPHYSPSSVARSLAEAPATDARAEAAGRLARNWGALDPEAALAWGLGLEGADAVAALRGAASAWARTDAFSLSDHLLAMPPGEPRDLATIALVEGVVAGDPDSAWRWTDRVDDPTARLETRRRVIEAWAADDRVAARDAVDAAPLSAAEREALLAAIRE